MIKGGFCSMDNRRLIKSTCSLIFLLSLLALATPPAMAETAWQQVGGELPGSLTSLFVDNGTPYVVCTDASGKIVVMEYDGASWQTVGGSTLFRGQEDWVSLFVYDGTPYVAYRDDNDLKFSVMEFEGGVWTPVGTPIAITSSSDYGSTIYDSFYVDQGIPYLASEDGTGSVTVMKYASDGAGWRPVGGPLHTYTGNWVELGMPGYPGVLAPVSLVVYEGTPYVAVRNIVIKYNGTAWESVGNADFLSVKTDYESLCVYNETPYVAYQSQVYNTSSVSSEVYDEWNSPVTSGVIEYNGATWLPVGDNLINISADTADDSLFVYDGLLMYVRMPKVKQQLWSMTAHRGNPWATPVPPTVPQIGCSS